MGRAKHHGVSEQSKAGQHRRDDARALFEKQRWRGAMYLGGYSVECLLKSSLMRKYECHTIGDLEVELKKRGLIATESTIYTHQFEAMLSVSGDLDRLRSNVALWRSFNIVNRWIPAWRYDPDLSGPDESERFLIAIDQLSAWIRANI